MATLFRCPMPTDHLCPCGRAARALRRHDVEHETIVVPWRKARRPEVEALTGQRHVPVLVLGGEVVSDSRRILEHLEWRGSARA